MSRSRWERRGWREFLSDSPRLRRANIVIMFRRMAQCTGRRCGGRWKGLEVTIVPAGRSTRRHRQPHGHISPVSLQHGRPDFRQGGERDLHQLPKETRKLFLRWNLKCKVSGSCLLTTGLLAMWYNDSNHDDNNPDFSECCEHKHDVFFTHAIFLHSPILHRYDSFLMHSPPAPPKYLSPAPHFPLYPLLHIKPICFVEEQNNNCSHEVAST